MNGQLLLRAENFLLLIPLIFTFYLFGFTTNESIDIFIFGKYISVTHVDAIVFLLMVLLVPFTMHCIMRESKNRNMFIARVHVISSIVLILILLNMYGGAPMISRQWESALLPPPTYERWQAIMHSGQILWMVFFVLQAFYVIYAFAEFSFPEKRSHLFE